MMGVEEVVARAAVLFDAPPEEVAAEECSTSSSIGRNSDVSSERSMEEGENEVESVYNGPLHAMETLQEVLPIRYHNAYYVLFLVFFFYQQHPLIMYEILDLDLLLLLEKCYFFLFIYHCRVKFILFFWRVGKVAFLWVNC